MPLDYLEPGRSYVATIYADAADAHWKKNPTAYRIERVRVDNKKSLSVRLAPGGGAAVSIKPAS